MLRKNLTLLSGTQLVLGKTQTFILPEDHSDLGIFEEVALVNEQGETVGTGTVMLTQAVTPFAQLQQRHFTGSAHPGLTSWHEAADVLRSIVPGFCITDPTTILNIYIDTLLEPTLTIRAAEKPTEVEDPTISTEEAMALIEAEGVA